MATIQNKDQTLQFNYNLFPRKHTNSADPTSHLLDLDKAGQKFCLFIE